MRTTVGLMALFSALTLAAGCAPDPAPTPAPAQDPVSPVLAAAAEAAPPQAPPATPTSLIRQETPVALPTPRPTPTAAEANPPTAEATQVTPTAPPTATPPPPTAEDGLPADHYILARPISEGYTTYLDRTYPYGGTSGGRFRPHTGVEFFNPEGTPVLAVANGVVEYAGTDAEILYGPQPNFYGNLIVLRLDATFNGRPIFALYGHLSQMYVTTGETVSIGQTIGAVGGTGIANGGAHLHFEVRLDSALDYFTATRNPDLWIRPYYGYGTLAGRITGADGSLLPEVSITIKTDDWVRYTWTYAGAENIPSETWGENFTYGDLPEGWYSVTFGVGGKTYREQVYIRAGRTSWLEFATGG